MCKMFDARKKLVSKPDHNTFNMYTYNWYIIKKFLYFTAQRVCI